MFARLVQKEAETGPVRRLRGNTAAVHSTGLFLEASRGFAAGLGVPGPQPLRGRGRPRPNPRVQVISVHEFRPHAGFSAEHQVPVLCRAVESERIAVVELFPVAAGEKVIQVPAGGE